MSEEAPRTPQGWADLFASTVNKMLMQAEDEGWVSELPPDAALRLRTVLDAYLMAYDALERGTTETEKEEA